jgi:hypothetical protein
LASVAMGRDPQRVHHPIAGGREPQRARTITNYRFVWRVAAAQTALD